MHASIARAPALISRLRTLYVREYTTYREAETLQLAIELVLSTVKYLQRAHASYVYMYMYIPVPTCTYVRSIAIGTCTCVAWREGSVRAWSYALRVQIIMRVTRTWYTRTLVKSPLGGTVLSYLPQVGLEPTTLYTLDRALYQLSYRGSSAGWAQTSHLIVHLMNRLTINSVCTCTYYRHDLLTAV